MRRLRTVNRRGRRAEQRAAQSSSDRRKGKSQDHAQDRKPPQNKDKE